MSTSKAPKQIIPIQEEPSDEGQHVSDRVKLYEANLETSNTPTQMRTNNINHSNNLKHVVPVGVLIVLFTLYLTATALSRNYANQQDQTDEMERIERTRRFQELNELELARRTQILAKLLEYKDLCTELEIFTKDLRWFDEFSSSGHNVVVERGNGFEAADADIHIDLDEHDELEDASVNNQHTSINGGESSGHGKLAPKATNGKQRVKRNGQRQINKSIKIKNGRTKHETKKDQPTKKTSTAEPIIYLFALVFIYLLLKAASDINQHYKSQNKGDKRIRRCSLQSYAQTHKQDRRASKASESPKILNKHLLLAESRSKSFDRCNDPTIAKEMARKKSEILANLRKFTSLDEQPQQLVKNRYIGWDAPLTADVRQSGENIFMNSANNLLGNRAAESAIATAASNRRCSVPVSMNYQRQKLGAIPLGPMSTVPRRTSISGVHIGVSDGEHGVTDAQFQEGKRRVRMINRH